jgi:deoxyribose-phosphate aldolase
MDTNAENIDLAPFIDLALLSPTATAQELAKCCQQAERFHFATVCLYSSYIRQAVDLLHGKPTKVCSVIGFPTGATTSASKLYEAQEAVDNGAKELDVVINLAWLKDSKSNDIYRELAAICSETGVVIKAIIETNLLTDTEKQLAVEICLDAGATFIKTCTGWFGGVTVADVKLIKEVAKDRIGIKASGGIHTKEQAIDLILAGATRLGTSRGVEIVTYETR